MKTPINDPWSLSAADYPADGTLGQQWEFLLRYAILAPSSHNTQPWLFRLRHTLVDIYADRQRACPVVDPDDRELIMSCGCAVFHLKTALRHFNCLGPVEIYPEHHPDLVARVHRGTTGEMHPDQALIFEAITRRHTNRQPFEDRAIPDEAIGALTAAAESEGAGFTLIHSEPTRLALAQLISEADRKQWSDPAFRQELARWVHANHSVRRDGIPGYAVGVDDLLSCMGPLVVRTFDMGEGEAARDEALALGSPALAVLCTPGDKPHDWVAAGQALSHVLLRASALGLSASFLDQPLELPDLRNQLADIIGTPDHPQVILRIGYGESVRATPRREVVETLLA